MHLQSADLPFSLFMSPVQLFLPIWGLRRADPGDLAGIWHLPLCDTGIAGDKHRTTHPSWLQVKPGGTPRIIIGAKYGSHEERRGQQQRDLPVHRVLARRIRTRRFLAATHFDTPSGTREERRHAREQDVLVQGRRPRQQAYLPRWEDRPADTGGPACWTQVGIWPDLGRPGEGDPQTLHVDPQWRGQVHRHRWMLSWRDRHLRAVRRT